MLTTSWRISQDIRYNEGIWELSLHSWLGDEMRAVAGRQWLFSQVNSRGQSFRG